MKSKSETKSQYALVTGATSGIGYELAKEAVADGYNLILVARDETLLQKVKDEFSFTNREVITIAKDLFEPNAAKEIYDEVKSLGLNVTMLINDAGQGQHGKFIENDLDRHLDVVQLNISSLVSLTYFFMKDMVANDEGKILQVGSEVSKVPMPLMAVYAATKAFVLSFTEALINELQDSKVTMTLLMPGATDTDFFDKADAVESKVYQEGKLEAPETVAKAAYKALIKGDRRIIASNAKLNVAMAAVMPDNVNAANLRKSMEPADKKNDK